jgi:pimeloyl-ACP methyl ester carboxylesterase
MKTIQYQNKKIAYHTKGQGETIVLLHGFMEDMDMWDAHSEVLSENYQVITIDLPGHGKSQVVAEIHSMEMMAEIVKTIIDQEKVDSCVLVGHSMGGYATLAFAELYPERLKGFGLFHSHSLADHEKAKINRERTIDLVKQKKGGFINQFIPSLFAEDNRIKFKAQIEKQIKKATNMDITGITAALAGMKERPMRLDMIAYSKVPVLFILGKQDSRIPFEKAMAQASTANTLQLNIFGQAGHMSWLEEQDATIAALSGFMILCK